MKCKILCRVISYCSDSYIMVIYTLINSFFTLLNLVFFFYNIIDLITTLSHMIDNVPEVAVFLVRIVLLLTADGSPDFFS